MLFKATMENLKKEVQNYQKNKKNHNSNINLINIPYSPFVIVALNNNCLLIVNNLSSVILTIQAESLFLLLLIPCICWNLSFVSILLFVYLFYC